MKMNDSQFCAEPLNLKECETCSRKRNGYIQPWQSVFFPEIESKSTKCLSYLEEENG